MINRSFKHLTPSYVKGKVQYKLHEKFFPGRPWLTQSVINILDSALTKDDIAIETGSGRSTAWFSSKVRHLTSIEHDKVWYERVNAQLENLDNVEYLLKEGESEYVKVLEDFRDHTVDFCLIDGLERDLCGLAALPKMRRGGMLVVDNVNWYLPSNSRSPNARKETDGCATEAWQLFQDIVSDWRKIWTTNNVQDTCIWIKP